MNSFGNRLKALRKEKKLTQAQLGELLKTSHATINRYEKNIYQPDINTIKEIANIFNVTADYLLGMTDKRDVEIIEDKEIKKKLSEIEIDYLEIARMAKEKGFTPKDIKDLLETVERIKNNNQ